jgi:hypothetical protein
MTISADDTRAFKNYLEPLGILEEAFRLAGILNIEFRAFVAGGCDKRIEISFGGRVSKVVSIEGDNPAAAIKDVAAAVKL